MASEAASGGLTEYITHHLTHNAQTLFGFEKVHFDSLFTSMLVGAIAFGWLYSVARKATAGSSSRWP